MRNVVKKSSIYKPKFYHGKKIGYVGIQLFITISSSMQHSTNLLCIIRHAHHQEAAGAPTISRSYKRKTLSDLSYKN